MALLIEVKVAPSSGRQHCTIDKNGTIKCFLKSPPEKGQANSELIKVFSKLLHIPQLNITILSGLTSRKKVVKIEGDVTREIIINAIT